MIEKMERFDLFFSLSCFPSFFFIWDEYLNDQRIPPKCIRTGSEIFFSLAMSIRTVSNAFRGDSLVVQIFVPYKRRTIRSFFFPRNPSERTPILSTNFLKDAPMDVELCDTTLTYEEMLRSAFGRHAPDVNATSNVTSNEKSPTVRNKTLIFMNGLSSQNKMLLEIICRGNENFFLNALSYAGQVSFNHRRIEPSPVGLSVEPTWELITFDSLPVLPFEVWNMIFERAFQLPRTVKPATVYGEMGKLRSGYDTILNMLMGFGKHFYCDHSRFIMTYLSYRYISFSNTPEGHRALKRYTHVNTPPSTKTKSTFKIRSKTEQSFISNHDELFFDHYVNATGGVTTVRPDFLRPVSATRGGKPPTKRNRGDDAEVDTAPDALHEDPMLDIFYEPYATQNIVISEKKRLEKKLLETPHNDDNDGNDGETTFESHETTIKKNIFYYDPLCTSRSDGARSRIVVLPQHTIYVTFNRAILPVMSPPTGIPSQLIKPFHFLDKDGNSEDDELNDFEVRAIAKSGTKKIWLTNCEGIEGPFNDGRRRSYASLVLCATEANLHVLNQMEGISMKRTFSIKSGFSEQELETIAKRDVEEAKKKKKVTWNTTMRRMIKIDKTHYLQKPSEWIAVIKYPMGKRERETFGIYDVGEGNAIATTPPVPTVTQKMEERATLWAVLSPEQWYVSLSSITRWSQKKESSAENRPTKRRKYTTNDGDNDGNGSDGNGDDSIILMESPTHV